MHHRGRRYTRFNNTVRNMHPGNPRWEKLWHKMLSFFLCKEYIYKLYIRRIKFKQTNKIDRCPFSSVSQHQWISAHQLLYYHHHHHHYLCWLLLCQLDINYSYLILKWETIVIWIFKWETIPIRSGCRQAGRAFS